MRRAQTSNPSRHQHPQVCVALCRTCIVHWELRCVKVVVASVGPTSTHVTELTVLPGVCMRCLLRGLCQPWSNVWSNAWSNATAPVGSLNLDTRPADSLACCRSSSAWVVEAVLLAYAVNMSSWQTQLCLLQQRGLPCSFSTMLCVLALMDPEPLLPQHM